MIMAGEIERVERVPLPDGKIYHFNVIYNHARCPSSQTLDTELSRQFTENVVTTLASLGFVDSYYHERDTRLGSNVFEELFRVLEGSDYTIIILTPGFVADCWKRYIQMTLFKTLLDSGQNYRFLPLSVGLSADELPQELNTQNVLYFQRDWERDEMSWNRLKAVFTEGFPVPVVQMRRNGDRPLTTQAVEETNAQGLNRPDEFDGDPIRQDDTIEPLHPDRTANGNNLNHPDTGTPSDPEVNPRATDGQGRPGDGVTNQSTAAGRPDTRPGGSDVSGASNSTTPNVNDGQRAWSASRSNEGNYSDISIDLQRSQATVHGRVGPQTGPTSDRSIGEQSGVMPRGYVGTDLQQSSLSMDEDLESSIVSRLERGGISDYRSELAHQNQTYRKIPFESEAQNLDQREHDNGQQVQSLDRREQDNGQQAQNLDQREQDNGQQVQNLGQRSQNSGQEVNISRGSQDLDQGNNIHIQISKQREVNQSRLHASTRHAEDEEGEIVNEDGAQGREDTRTASEDLSPTSSSSSYTYTGNDTPASIHLQTLCGNPEGATSSDSAEPVDNTGLELSPVDDSGRGTGDVSPKSYSGLDDQSSVSTPEKGSLGSIESINSGLESTSISPVTSFSPSSSSETVIPRESDAAYNSNGMPQTSSGDPIGVTEEHQERVGESERFVGSAHSVVSESVEESSSFGSSGNLGTVPSTPAVETATEPQDFTTVTAANDTNQEEVIYRRTMDTRSDSEGPYTTPRNVQAGTGARGWILPLLSVVGHALFKPDPFYF